MDVIFDIDGALADITHRRSHVDGGPKNWAAFQAAAHLDLPNEPICVLARSLPTLSHRIVLCTGRGEQERPVTEAWLDRYQIYHEGLYMRTEGDYRADDVIKSELLDRIIADGFKPQLVFDDRDRVVRFWRSRGIVCAQVAEGSF